MATQPLFVTKLIIPKRQPQVLRRPRLLDFLHEYIDRKLLLVSASAGYGKTTLLVDFANDTELPVCWYSLDTGDSDPQVFLEYLVASIQRQFPRFGARTTALLQDPARAKNLDAVVGTLVTEMYEDISEYFTIVLDDYHLIDSSERINHILDNLLNYLPENAHLVLASRTLPTHLTLTRLTARQQVAGLGVKDLRFHADEIRALMKQNYRLEITEAVAQQLAEQSEGWIAGIVLTTPLLWRGFFEDWVKARGPGSQLFDYLAGEVLSQQPAELQRFLQDTSILDQMTAALCNELLGISDAQTRLDQVESRNLFITRLDDASYRYHHLFREFLQTRLRHTDLARALELHERAAELFERRGNFGEAVEQWLKSENFEQAARVIEMVAGSLYDQGRWTTLARWIDALPEGILQAAPGLLLRRGKIFTETGELSRAQMFYERARREFETRADQTNIARLLIEEGVVARLLGQMNDCISKCQEALAHLDPHELTLHAHARRTIGAALMAQGAFSTALPELERGLELYQRADDLYNMALSEHDLGVGYRAIGQPRQADTHFEKALNHWRQLGSAADLAYTLNSIGVGHYYRGELELALNLLEQALQQARQVGYLRSQAYVQASLGDVYRDLGEFDRAFQAYSDAFEIAEKIREAFLITFTLCAMSDTWRLGGTLQSAEQVAHSAVQAAQSHRSDYESALAEMALGAVRLEQERLHEAVNSLEHVLELCERAQLKRESARAHYFLAQAYFSQKHSDNSRRHLEALAVLGASLGEDQFLLSEGMRVKPLVQYAIRRGLGNSYFRRVLRHLEKTSRAPQQAVGLIEGTWPRLEITTLGSAQVRCDDKLVDKSAWQTATTKELFFYFVVTAPQAWRKEQIIATLWPDMPRAQANDIFHVSIFRIRRALFSECLLYRNGVYELNPEAERWVDVNEFEKLLSESGQTHPESEAAPLLRRALDLYQGDFLEEFYSDWCGQLREQLREQYFAALTRLGAYYARVGDFSEALDLYQTGLAKDRTREEIYHGMISLYSEIGDLASARHIYRRCIQVLAEDLDAQPMPETVELYNKISQKK